MSQLHRMRVRSQFVLSCVCLLGLLATPARAQEAAVPPAPGVSLISPAGVLGGFSSSQWRLERISEHHWRLTGQVEIEREGLTFFADDVELFTDTNRLVATGNVVFTNKDGRISAEKVEFDTKRMVGTFTDASGIFTLGPKADRALFGGQDPDVYFYGDSIEKLGDKRYRLTRGAFTTCVQPTPRWEFTSGSVVIDVNSHAVMRNSVFRVKGVPMLYLPYAYYPLHKEQRSTGFLLPTYGASTIRGQAISNAFFWAIGRSHDATFFHDWFTKTGQGEGAEYRYIAGAGAQGTFRAYLFNQKAATFTTSGVTSTLPATNSTQWTGSATQPLPRGLRARAQFSYFSSLTTNQLYQGNLYDASQRNRTIGGSLTGNWGRYGLSTVYQRNEVFDTPTTSFVYGSAPRVTATVSPTRLFGWPLYAGVVGETAHLVSRDLRGATPIDNSLTRTDVSPTLRAPFSKLTFLTVTSTVSYHLTHYTASLDPTSGREVQSPLTRSYLALHSEVIGPVFSRIFDTSGGTFAERLKHVIEPSVAFDQTTAMNNYKQVVAVSDYTDIIVGGLTKLTYGVTNRLIAKTRGPEGTARTREFLTAAVKQSYYSKPEAGQVDTAYASSNRSLLSSVSPLAISVRAAPTSSVDVTVLAEESLTGNGLQNLSASGAVHAGRQTVSASWSRQHITPTTPVNDFLTSSANLRFHDNRLGGDYLLSWDVARGYIVSQTARAFYNAQCCGLTFQYQRFSYPVGFPVPSDRRIQFSIILAGLGTFGNFFSGQR